MTFNPSDPYYWIFPLLSAAFFAALYFILRKRSAKVQNIVLFCILVANFALHFLKLKFPPYSQMDFADAIQTITPENVCAINTMLFPFLFLTRGVFKDYMFYLGVISGIAAIFLPESIEDCVPFDFDCMRYYFCHTVLWVVPLLMVVLGRHKLNYRRIGIVPLIYLLTLCIIVANEVALVALGFDNLGYILSSDHGNGGLAFGPYTSMEGTTALKILLFVVPAPFKPGQEGGSYWPVAWQAFPAFIYGCPLGFLLCLYWEKRRFTSDMQKIASMFILNLLAFRFGRKVCRYRLRYGKKGFFNNLFRRNSQSAFRRAKMRSRAQKSLKRA